MRRAFTFALCSLLLAGCSSRGSKTVAKDGGGTSAPPGSQATHTVPGPVQVVGRVIAVDLRTLSVIIELAPYATLPADFSGRILMTRLDDLRPTARLQASSYLRGRTLGARLMAGQPQIGNEVVFVPVVP
ncbi:MAG: hypothetical protein K0R17_3266 [Rariglobus sp.]|jgi:hypothetical protein|nr:hypothetical protein [Rariglobus sp.]